MSKEEGEILAVEYHVARKPVLRHSPIDVGMVLVAGEGQPPGLEDGERLLQRRDMNSDFPSKVRLGPGPLGKECLKDRGDGLPGATLSHAQDSRSGLSEGEQGRSRSQPDETLGGGASLTLAA